MERRRLEKATSLSPGAHAAVSWLSTAVMHRLVSFENLAGPLQARTQR